MGKAGGGRTEEIATDAPKTKKKTKRKKKGGERDLEAGLLPPPNPLSGDVPNELVDGEGLPNNPFV